MKGCTNAWERRLIVVIDEGAELVGVREGDSEDSVRWRLAGAAP